MLNNLLLISISIYLMLSGLVVNTLPASEIYIGQLTNSAAYLIMIVSAACFAWAGIIKLSKVDV